MKVKNPLLLIVLSWLVSALTIAGIALAVLPNTYVDGFLYRVAWIEFLNILFWFGTAGWFIENKTNSRMAITPATGFLTSIYCALSLVLIFAFYQDESLNGISKAHLVIQIVLFGLYALLMLRLQLAMHFANKDLVLSQEAAMAPADLSQRIKFFEKNCSKDVAKELKKLREKIAYSLQDNNRMRTNDKYKKLVGKLTGKMERNDMSEKDIQEFIIAVEDLAHTTKRG